MNMRKKQRCSRKIPIASFSAFSLQELITAETEAKFENLQKQTAVMISVMTNMLTVAQNMDSRNQQLQQDMSQLADTIKFVISSLFFTSPLCSATYLNLSLLCSFLFSNTLSLLPSSMTSTLHTSPLLAHQWTSGNDGAWSKIKADIAPLVDKFIPLSSCAQKQV